MGESLTLPFRAVGLIQVRVPGRDWGQDGLGGTGVLVGPWHVLTASHVVTGDPAGAEYRFLPAYWDGERTLPSFGAASATIVGFVGIHTDAASGFDYMVCELDRSLGVGWGWNGTHSSTSDGYYTNNSWASIGYPADLADGERPYRNTMSISAVEDAEHDSNVPQGRAAVPVPVGRAGR